MTVARKISRRPREVSGMPWLRKIRNAYSRLLHDAVCLVLGSRAVRTVASRQDTSTRQQTIGYWHRQRLRLLDVLRGRDGTLRSLPVNVEAVISMFLFKMGFCHNSNINFISYKIRGKVFNRMRLRNSSRPDRPEPTLARESKSMISASPNFIWNGLLYHPKRGKKSATILLFNRTGNVWGPLCIPPRQ